MSEVERAYPGTITSLFLYGAPEAPADLRHVLEPRGEQSRTYSVDAVAYMASEARFAVPARAPIVQAFFSGNWTPPGTPDPATGRLEVRFGDLLNILDPNGGNGLGSNEFAYNNMNVATGTSDYAYRTYVWGQVSFKISDDAKFVIDSDGTRWIENLAVRPFDTDFDLKSSSFWVQQGNDLVLHDLIDEYDIGQKVFLIFPEDSKLALEAQAAGSRYTGQNYIADLNSINDLPDVAGIVEAYARVTALAQELRSDGTIVLQKEGREVVFGSHGDDTVTGSDTGDYVVSGAGRDLIVGGAGNDKIIAGAGDDIIWGGALGQNVGAADGTDTVDYAGVIAPIAFTFKNGAVVVKDGEGGTDTLHSIEEIIGTDKRDTFKFEGKIPNNYVLKIDGGGGQAKDDVINIRKATAGMAVDITETGGTLTNKSGGSGRIDLVNFHTQIIGSDFGDAISDLTSGHKKIDAGGGNDEVTVSIGSADINGGGGDDTLNGGDGNDILVGGSGINRLSGGGGHDLIISTSGGSQAASEIIDGGAGHDFIKVTAHEMGSVIVRGGGGNDVIVSNIDEAVTTAIFGAGDGHDTIINGIIHLSGLNIDDVTILWDVPDVQDSSPVGDLAIVINATGESIFIPNVAGTVIPDLIHPDISLTFDTPQRPYFSTRGDVVLGSNVAQYNVAGAAHAAGFAAERQSMTSGTPGNDELTGTPGDDLIEGGDGDDIAEASGGNDRFDGGTGFNGFTVFGARSDYDLAKAFDILLITDRDDASRTELISVSFIYFAVEDVQVATHELMATIGTGFDDALISTILDEPIDGGDGIDTVVYEGRSSDFYLSRMADGSVIVRDRRSGDGFIDPSSGTEGRDRLTGVEFITFAGDNFTFAIADLPAAPTDDPDTLVGSAVGDEIDGGEGDDSLSGGLGDDALYGGSGFDTLNGGEGDDLLEGGTFGDLIDGGGGHDVLRGGHWFDTLIGGAGDDLLEGGGEGDVLEGGDGHDVLRGEDGQDTLRGGDGNDRLEGGEDWDRLEGGAGNDALYGGESEDSLEGGDGADLLEGGDHDDLLRGGLGADILRGDGGDDRLRGEDGDDQLFGGEGEDELDGGAGDDELDGGDDDDFFDESTGDDSYRGGLGTDTLYVYAERGDYDLSEDAGLLVITRRATGDSMRLEGIEFVCFDYEGDIVSVADLLALVRAGIVGTEGEDTLSGSDSADDSIFGGGGNDTLYGLSGDDRLEGGSGNDSLFGGDGIDLLYGGTGADRLEGGAGNDVYFYEFLDGSDTIIDTAGHDAIQLGAGIEPDEVGVALSYDGSNATVMFQGASGWFDAGTLEVRGVEELRFADGTVWDLSPASWESNPGDQASVSGTSDHRYEMLPMI